MRSDARARKYVVRRTREGLSKKEVHRRLKRYIVRELHPLILADLHDGCTPLDIGASMPAARRCSAL